MDNPPNVNKINYKPKIKITIKMKIGLFKIPIIIINKP